MMNEISKMNEKGIMKNGQKWTEKLNSLLLKTNKCKLSGII